MDYGAAPRLTGTQGDIVPVGRTCIRSIFRPCFIWTVFGLAMPVWLVFLLVGGATSVRLTMTHWPKGIIMACQGVCKFARKVCQKHTLRRHRAQQMCAG